MKSATRIAALWVSFFPGMASAEGESLADLMKAATVDMPITTAPASFLLGASGENVPRLSSFRAFSTQAARAFDEKGNVVNAVGVELAPALALGNMTWEDIQGSAAKRIWSRTTVSFATKVGSEKQGAQSAIGLQAILYAPSMEGAILKAAKDECRSAASAVDTSPPAMEPGKPKPLSDDTLKRIEACQTGIDALLTKWNQTLVSIGGGRTFAAGGTPSNASPKDSSAFWLTAAYGGDIGSLKESSETRTGYLVTGHIRRTTNVTTTDTGGTDVAARQQLVGINARYGNAKLAGIGEYSTVSSKASASDFRDRKRSLLGIEYKLDKDMYLTLGVARDTGLDSSKQSVLAKLNWGFSKSPTLLAGK